MSTENQEVSVEPASEEKTETKEVKGTKRAAEVSVHPSIKSIVASSFFFAHPPLSHQHTAHNRAQPNKKPNFID